MGQFTSKRRFGEPLKSPVIPFGAMVRFLHETSQGFTDLAGKFCQEYFSDMQFNIWKEMFLSQTLRNGKTWTEIHPRRINAKEVLTPQRREFFDIPSNRCDSKIVRTRPRIPRTHSKAGATCWECRSQRRTSRRTRRASTDRIK